MKRNETDAADACALLEAGRCADIEPVRVESVEQQALQGLHRIRSLWMGTRTARINALRGFCREFGLALPPGARFTPSPTGRGRPRLSVLSRGGRVEPFRTTSKAGRCVPRPPSTTHAISVSASTCVTCPRFAASASKPTDLLDVQSVSHDCAIGEDAFDQMVRPIDVDGQRATALRFGDARTQALLNALVLFSVQTQGFTHAQLRTHLANLLGINPGDFGAGRMTYDLRRLRPHGLIRRSPKTNRYQITDQGLKIAMFFSRTYTRLLRPGLAEITESRARPARRYAPRSIDFTA